MSNSLDLLTRPPSEAGNHFARRFAGMLGNFGDSSERNDCRRGWLAVTPAPAPHATWSNVEHDGGAGLAEFETVEQDAEHGLTAQKLRLNAKPLNDATDSAMARHIPINKHGVFVGVLQYGNQRREIVRSKSVAHFAGGQQLTGKKMVATVASGDAVVGVHGSLLGGRACALADVVDVGQNGLAVNGDLR